MFSINKLDEARDVLESAIAQSMVIYGVTPSVGRIYSVLYFAKGPMTLKEIQAHIAMSKASVSSGVRELLETEMVTKVWKKGERNDHFIAEKDFFRNLTTYLSKKLRQEKNIIMKAVKQAEPILHKMADEVEDSIVKENIEQDIELIKESKAYLEWTMRLTNAMESDDIFNLIPK